MTLPDGREITEAQLEEMKREARAWVRRMLQTACIPCSAHAIEEMERTVRDIVSLYVDYGYIWNGHLELTSNGERRKRELVTDLILRLEALLYLYASAAEEDEKDKAALLLWLKGEYHGMTIEQRVERQVNAIGERLTAIIEGDALSNGGIIPSDIAVAAGTIVGVKGLKRLLETEVARGWQHKWGRDHRDAMFVHVFRGSSYNCAICDDVVALGWQLVGSATIPPIHPNCRCYTVYI